MKNNYTPEQILLIEEGKKVLKSLENQRFSVTSELKCGIINVDDAANEYDMISLKEKQIKEKMVLAVHITAEGLPRKIVYQESKDLWYTQLEGKKRVYAKSEDALIDKLFVFYGLTIEDYSLKGIFDLALEEKRATNNSNEYTIERYEYDFKRYIKNSFYKKDIRKITKSDIKKYTQDLVNELHPTKKSFFQYKSVLNLIFEYALEFDIIDVNPLLGIRNAAYYKSCNTVKKQSEEKILSQDEIELVKDTVRKYMGYKVYNGYFINGYAILFSIETGVRAAEIPALKWEDISDTNIHIHAQQLSKKAEGGKEYYYAPWTKNEKGVSSGGRYFPLTNSLRALLTELKLLQKRLNIKSEYIFCHEDGEWIKTDAYETCLRRMLKSLGFSVTNNHAFRMSLNSNIFIPLNIPVTDRARLLGHTVETNLKHYSYAGKDNIGDICSLLNNQISKNDNPDIISLNSVKKNNSSLANFC